MKKELNAKHSYDFERSFDYIWEKVVFPSISFVDEQMDADFKEAAGVCRAYENDSDFKEDVMEFYREKREWLKSIYLPHEKNPVLDEHKLGAIWCRTMLAYKPFYFDIEAAENFVEKKFGTNQAKGTDPEELPNNSEWFTKNIYSNYRVAFIVSIGIVYLYLLYDCKEKGENLPEYLRDAYEYFRERKTLRRPRTTEAHNDFETSCIIALQKNDIQNRDFDYLAYAIILFQLEHYNRMCYYIYKNNLPLDAL